MVSSYLIVKTLFGLKRFFCGIIILSVFFSCGHPGSCSAWYDETHIAIAKRTGYRKWFNACGADMAKLKAGKIEIYNHYVNNPPGEVITAKSVLEQVGKYNNPLDEKGHLYGAIIASVRDYLRARSEGKYGEYYLAFCAHYVGDLSMPLHNTLYDSFNETHHQAMDATINDEVLLHLERIEIYPIRIDSEDALAEEVARIARLSMKLGYRLEKENRLLTREEAYKQISHSASLFKAILNYVGK